MYRASMKLIVAAALAASLGACTDRGGWYATFTCQERNLRTGLCSKAVYSCTSSRELAFFPEGTVRCYSEKELL